MSYKVYTTCVAAQSHVKMNQYVQMVIQGLIAGAIAVLFVAVVGEPWCLIPAGAVMLAVTDLGYCHWWLEDRLVCLGADTPVDVSAIGMLVSTEPASGKGFPGCFDTDFSINILVAPNLPGDSEQKVASSSPYGNLVAEQDLTKNEGLQFKRDPIHDAQANKDCWCLHAEFEGGGVADALLGAQIALGLAVIGLILCLAIPGVWGAVLGAIFAILAILAGLLGALLGLGDTGSATDVNPNLGSLHSTDGQDPPDVLYVQGRWVYDSGHNNEDQGWNEIHPIKYCTKVGTFNGTWPATTGVLIAKMDGAVGEAQSPVTKDEQKKPENLWLIHPLIDGCKPKDEPPK
jgi:hypothetical protein